MYFHRKILFLGFLSTVAAVGDWYCLVCSKYVEYPSQCDILHVEHLYYDSYRDLAIADDSQASEPPRQILEPPPQVPEPRPQFLEPTPQASSSFQLTLKRPSNSFFLYKQERINQIKYRNVPMAERVSQIALEWKKERQEVKDKYTQEQEAVSANFKLQNPDYKYSPKRSPRPPRDEDTSRKKRKGKEKASQSEDK